MRSITLAVLSVPIAAFLMQGEGCHGDGRRLVGEGLVLPVIVGSTVKVFSLELGWARARSLTTVDITRAKEVFSRIPRARSGLLGLVTKPAGRPQLPKRVGNSQGRWLSGWE